MKIVFFFLFLLALPS